MKNTFDQFPADDAAILTDQELTDIKGGGGIVIEDLIIH